MENLKSKTVKQNHVKQYKGPDGKLMQRIRIVFAADLAECECCGEPFCDIHGEHFGDCECIGPCNAEDDGWELEERDGILYGIRPLPAGGCVDPDESTCEEIENTENQ